MLPSADRRRTVATVACLVLVILSGCTGTGLFGPQSTPTPEMTSTTMPTATVTPSSTPTATPTGISTNTLTPESTPARDLADFPMGVHEAGVNEGIIFSHYDELTDGNTFEAHSEFRVRLSERGYDVSSERNNISYANERYRVGDFGDEDLVYNSVAWYTPEGGYMRAVHQSSSNNDPAYIRDFPGINNVSQYLFGNLTINLFYGTELEVVRRTPNVTILEGREIDDWTVLNATSERIHHGENLRVRVAIRPDGLIRNMSGRLTGTGPDGERKRLFLNVTYEYGTGPVEPPGWIDTAQQRGDTLDITTNDENTWYRIHNTGPEPLPANATIAFGNVAEYPFPGRIPPGEVRYLSLPRGENMAQLTESPPSGDLTPFPYPVVLNFRRADGVPIAMEPLPDGFGMNADGDGTPRNEDG